ncbi:AraC-like DNA-binding protein [Zhongshania antarctica]|uniref:AraC-like DNA-binding protein n=1 Tax=Zhongshania antarctica TaxID=641702 RepID=A0A840RAD2_9GAMM|nr:AraC family transcriptional regulator [Zhongshania antarctica]MBB5189261.1 AraC-like DNA-binding protein [Zhongshania antarctica]
MSQPKPTFWKYFQEMLVESNTSNSLALERLEALLQTIGSNPFEGQHEELAEILQIMSELPTGHELAYQAGSNIPMTAYAPLVIPMKFAPTIRDSLNFLRRYLHLQVPLIAVNFDEEEGSGIFSLSYRVALPDHASTFLATGAFSALNTDLSLITGSSRNFQSVSLKYCAAEYISTFSKHFGVTPMVGADKYSVTLSEKLLNTPNPLADPFSFNSYREDYEEQLRINQLARSRSEEIRQELMAQIDSPPNLRGLAMQLHISERQLRFSLSKEDTSYRKILMQCRIDYSRTQLANPRMNITNLANKLGYSDLTAFIHSFKRWTGKTPKEFQNEILSNNIQKS